MKETIRPSIAIHPKVGTVLNGKVSEIDGFWQQSLHEHLCNFQGLLSIRIAVIARN